MSLEVVGVYWYSTHLGFPMPEISLPFNRTTAISTYVMCVNVFLFCRAEYAIETLNYKKNSKQFRLFINPSPP